MRAEDLRGIPAAQVEELRARTEAQLAEIQRLAAGSAEPSETEAGS